MPESIYPNALSMIGNTPIVKLNNFDTGCCELYVKLESMNPGGSIKDRPALAMIEAAEKAGKIKPGGTLVEATAGNTGLGLALVANQKGYKLKLVLPDKMSQEKIFHLKAAGAEIVMTRSDVQKGHPEYYQDLAEKIASEMDNAFYVNQFANENNVYAHQTMTGPEIWKQMEGKLDAIVCGVGTGGTLTGIGRYMQQVAPNVEMILADPQGSVLKHYIDTGEMTEAKSWLVEGIGEDFIPSICDIDLAKKAYTISDKDSFLTARELLDKEGILAGSSSGTMVNAALRYCKEQTTPKTVLTFVCDSGNKYFSKMFNDFWMRDHGFIERERFNDLRDLIARGHWEKNTIVARPQEKVLTAYNRMRLYDISQLPILDNDDHIVGIIDESDILLAIVYDGDTKFDANIEEIMAKKIEVIHYKEPVQELMPIFNKDFVAIIVDDNQQFLGIITRIDLLNYLRRQQLKHW